MGAPPDDIRPLVESSPHYADGAFHNTELSHVLTPGQGLSMLPELWRHRGRGKPPGPIPVVTQRPPARAGDIAVSWLGHATTLLEVDGQYVLTDPVWGQRVSPSRTVGPGRMHPMPYPIEALPILDAILISHDHYDHLDVQTIRQLVRTQPAPFLVPLGIGAHLRRWGVPEDRIVELDWSQSHRLGDLDLTCTESRHFSGRGFRRNPTLWCSWVIAGPRHRVYFGGDTGYTAAFSRIGGGHGPFDVTVLPIGAYGIQWPDIHLDPEEAVRAHGDLGGGLLLPLHWATFDLALHSWAEPVERLLAAAGSTVPLAIPRPGGRVLPGGDAERDDWWRRLHAITRS
jgi:L-ascorbate metabolism protein UlaG (beta-lactamase superfamily)